MKRLLPVVLFILFAAPLHAQPRPRPASNGVSVGLAVPTSGPYAPIGKQLVEAAQLAASETGIRIVVADTEGDPKKAVEAVAKLAADPQILAIVGPLGQRESRAAASAAQRLGMPMFALTTNETVNQAGGWVFRVRSSPGEQARAMATVSRKTLKHQTVAIAYPQTEYGEEAARAFAEQFIREGGKVTSVANYPEDTTDYTGVLDVVVGKKVYLGKGGTVDRWKTDASGFARTRGKSVVDFDGLFIPDFHQRVARLLAFLPVVGIQNGNGGEGTAVQLLGLSGWQGKAMELAGGAAAGALYLDTFAGEAAGGRPEEFSRTFQTSIGRRPVDIEAETFDIVWLLGTLGPAAVSAGQGAPRANMVRLLPRRDVWTGVAGELKFGRDGEPLRGFGVYRFDADGSVAPIY